MHVRHVGLRTGRSFGVATAVVVLIAGLAQALTATAEVEQSSNRASQAKAAVPCIGSALPTLGGRNGNAVSVSAGAIVGIADDASGVSRPVIWRGGKATSLGIRLESAVPTSINRFGVVVGTGYDAASEVLVGWWWSNGTTHSLPVRRGDIALPEAIDDQGRVVGALVAGDEHSDGPGADEDERAAIWKSVRVLPRELPAIPGEHGSHAFAIASDETVGGVSLDSGGTPVLWDSRGGVHRLGTLSGQGGIVRGFDGRSDPVGQAAVSAGGTHAVTWNDSGGAVDLGTLGAKKASAAKAATSGVVVGSGNASVPGGSVTQAVAWIAGKANLLPPVSLPHFRGSAGTANAVAQVSGGLVVVGFSADAVGVRKPTIWRCKP